MIISFFVPGIPKPQGSKRAYMPKGGKFPVIVEDNKGTRDWRGDVKIFAQEAYSGAPIQGGVDIQVQFIMPRPKSTPKTRPTPRAIKQPDIDKMLRSILDSLTGTVWRDDSQVVYIQGTKRIAEIDEQPGARIRVEALDDPT